MRGVAWVLEAVVSGRRLIGGNLMIESAVPLGAGLLAKLALACQKAENALRWHALRRPKSESTRGHGGSSPPNSSVNYRCAQFFVRRDSVLENSFRYIFAAEVLAQRYNGAQVIFHL